ncbi:MAG TPA: Maf family protein [Ureibacillus sp.]|nr:Maf family protein [Ureibacillus sp.]
MKFTTNHKIVLASSSPRRKELLSKLGIPFEVVSSNVVETIIKEEKVENYVREVALLKARDVANNETGKTIIGADTIVVYQNQLLHKPKTTEEAISHLEKLSNNCHSVMTAIVIIDENGNEETFVEETKVYFRKLSPILINAYVNTGDPFDKAGGYGIQTGGALFIERIEGDYNNVVGFPLATVFEKLITLNILHIQE